MKTGWAAHDIGVKAIGEVVLAVLRNRGSRRGFQCHACCDCVRPAIYISGVPSNISPFKPFLDVIGTIVSCGSTERNRKLGHLGLGRWRLALQQQLRAPAAARDLLLP